MRLKLLFVGLLAICLGGCGLFHVHERTIEQGNIVDAKMIAKLKPGQTEAEVRNNLGTPMLVNTFNTDRMHYVYTYQVGTQPRETKRLTLYFKNNKLLRFKARGLEKE